MDVNGNVIPATYYLLGGLLRDPTRHFTVSEYLTMHGVMLPSMMTSVTLKYDELAYLYFLTGSHKFTTIEGCSVLKKLAKVLNDEGYEKLLKFVEAPGSINSESLKKQWHGILLSHVPEKTPQQILAEEALKTLESQKKEFESKLSDISTQIETIKKGMEQP